LPSLWQLPPPMPSALTQNIPVDLDALVSSLLSSDPLSRPSSSAEVMDRLAVIASLQPEEHEHAAESYLRSGRIVGRESEKIWMEEHVSRAIAGHGIEVTLQGRAGIGKTRLLNELGLHAQLKGMTVLKADGLAAPSPYGVARDHALQLLTACPEIAQPAARPHAAVLAHLSDELRVLLGVDELLALPRNPAERRALLQTALRDWFMEVARQRPLLVATDNLHVIEDNSGAFLASLGSAARTTHLIVLSTLRTEHAVVAPDPVRLMTGRGTQLNLAPLALPACTELVHSLFGDVQNAGRLARLLHDKSAGNPQQCMDLARMLVTKKIATYAGGTWVLPLEFSADELPSRVEEIFAARIALLTPDARRLAQTLSIHSTPLSLDLCLALSEEIDEAATYAALDALVSEEILVAYGGDYRFAREVLRELIVDTIPPVQRRAHHRHAGETLLQRAHEDLALQLAAAIHLLRAGDEARGAELLGRAGRRFLNATAIIDQSADQVVEALHIAFQAYAKQGRSASEQAELLLPMLTLAYYTPTQWRLIPRYADRAIELGLEITGIARARRLKRLLGRKLGLACALSWAGLRLSLARRRGAGYGLRTAIELVVGSIVTIQGTRALCLDAEALERVNRELEPLTYFGDEHLFALVYAFATNVQYVVQGRHSEVRARFPRIKNLLQDRKVIAALGAAPSKDLYGGCLWSMALQGTARFGDSALRYADETASLSIRVWEMAADQARLLYHALRGESEQAQHYRQRVEAFAILGSTTWQLDMTLPLGAACVAVRTRDSVAARRSFEQLRRLSESVPSLQVYADAARAGYLSLSGRIDEAAVLYESVVARMKPLRRVYWLATWASYAEVCNQLGQHARAKQLMLDGLSHADPEYRQFVGQCLEAERQLALAHAGLGEHQQALGILDGLLQRYAAEDQPLLLGSLHKARAEVALLVDDRAGFEAHFLQMERRFRATRNPALIAQCDQLLDRALRAGLLPSRALGRADALDSIVTQLRVGAPLIRSLTDAAADPLDAALHSILLRTHADVGYLYTFRGQSMTLTAATTPAAPPAQFEAQLTQQALAHAAGIDEEVTTFSNVETNATMTIATVAEGPIAGDQLAEFKAALVLLARGDARPVVVGGLILRAPPDKWGLLTQSYMAEIAALLGRRAPAVSPSAAPHSA
jgi:hypothetical protein